MSGDALRAYLLVSLAATSGIVGMSMVYQAAAGGGVGKLIIGVPLLFAGLWWAGRELGRSTLAHRKRKMEQHHAQ